MSKYSDFWQQNRKQQQPAFQRQIFSGAQISRSEKLII